MVWRIAVLMLVLALPAWAGNLEFTFPPGWVNVSSTASGADRGQIPPAAAGAITKLADPQYRMAAVDLEALQNGSLALVLATVAPETEAVTRDSLVRAEPEFQSSMLKGIQGGSCQLLALDITKIRDVDCGRLVYSLSASNQQFRALVYLIPSGNELGGIAFLCDPNVFEARIGFFDALAQSTKGVRQINPAEVAAGTKSTSTTNELLMEFGSYMFLAVAIGYGVHTMTMGRKIAKPEDAEPEA